MSDTLEALLQEGRTFPPPEEFRKTALDTDATVYDDAERDWQGFWAAQALELDWTQGVADDPRVGAAVREVVRRRQAQRRVQLPRPPRRTPATAIRSRSTGKASRATRRAVSYRDLLEETCRVANALRSFGVEKGDRVAIYMGMVPETVATMLACARIGARALGGVRRLQRAVAEGSHQRRARRRCSSPPTARGGAARSSR